MREEPEASADNAATYANVRFTLWWYKFRAKPISGSSCEKPRGPFPLIRWLKSLHFCFSAVLTASAVHPIDGSDFNSTAPGGRYLKRGKSFQYIARSTGGHHSFILSVKEGERLMFSVKIPL